MHADRADAGGGEPLRIRRALAARVGGGIALGYVPVEQIVRRGLIGDDVRAQPARGDRGEHISRVGDERDRPGAALRHRALDAGERIGERCRHGIDGARFETLGRALAVDLDHDAGGAEHGGGARLSGAHAAESGGEKEAAAQIRATEALRGAREDLVCALQHALRADVLPAARRETAPADEAALLEVVEHLLVGPAPDEVAVRHEHERGARMRRKHRDRLARLHDERLALGQIPERAHDRLVRGPVARGLAEGRVDDQALRILGHGQHILQQPQQALLPPSAAAKSRAVRFAAAHRGSPASA